MKLGSCIQTNEERLRPTREMWLLVSVALTSVFFGGGGGALSPNFEKRLLASSYLSFRLSAWNSSVGTGRIFMKFDI